jgi:hypothetical protein
MGATRGRKKEDRDEIEVVVGSVVPLRLVLRAG